MSYDSTSDTNRPSSSLEPASPPDDVKQSREGRKPFVKPELRRETDLVDGTGNSVSWN